MGALKLILLSSTTAPTTSTTSLCLLSPCPTRPFPFSLRALTAPFLHLRPPLFLSTSLPRCTSKLAAVESNNDGYDDSEEDFEELEEEADGAEHSESESDALIDVESLEKEAIDFVREFSSSLSKELIIEEDVKTDRKSRRRQKTVTKSIPNHLLPKVAIVGRPNVGKSALFNRLVGGTGLLLLMNLGLQRSFIW
uniref:G domain-containing protein n=1 Tax=Cannabis sativa TaxID=3483 RepID=A0A803QUF1_CANSA